MSEAKPASKIWLETNEGYVFGPGVYNLLISIKEKGTLKEASKSLGMSYRYAWGLIKKAEEKLESPLIKASKGGRRGGGSSKITNLGEQFILDFEKIQKLWVNFRNMYYNSTLINAEVIESKDNLVIRVDEDISLNSETKFNKGDFVKLRVMVA
jgi:molybdate transport repressor ModE-like protein